MSKNSYEFGYISPREKRKVLICKLVLGLMMAFCLTSLVIYDDAPLSSNLIEVSGLLAAFFGYQNLQTVKSELMELFEPPYQYVGLEFVFIGLAANIGSFFV